MIKDIKIQPSNELAYWIGLVHADGRFSKWMRKSGKQEIELHMESKSESLIKEFQKGLAFINRFPRYHYRAKRNVFTCKASVKSIFLLLQSLNLAMPKHKFVAPFFIRNGRILFGSYLAGIIDGDGDVRIKRIKYPQCVVRITSKFKETMLIDLIKQFLNCSVSNIKRSGKRYLRKEDRFIVGTWNSIEFLVSSKNFGFFLSFILPNMKLGYKKEKILVYIESKCALGGI